METVVLSTKVGLEQIKNTLAEMRATANPRFGGLNPSAWYRWLDELEGGVATIEEARRIAREGDFMFILPGCHCINGHNFSWDIVAVPDRPLGLRNIS